MSKREGSANPTLKPQPVLFEDLMKLDQASLTEGCGYFDCYRISESIRKYIDSAQLESESVAAKLLHSITLMSEKFDDPNEPFGPLAVFEGKRTNIPIDFQGLQNDELAKFVPKIECMTLSARVADVVWLNARSRRDIAEIAIRSYSKKVELHFSGLLGFVNAIDDSIDNRIFETLRRAFDINKSIKGKASYYPELIHVFMDVYERCKRADDLRALRRATELGWLRGLVLANDAIDALERSLSAHRNDDPFDRKKSIELLCTIHHSEGDDEAVTECIHRVADCSVEIAEKMSASAMASASWIRTAVSELRTARGPLAKSRIQGLRKRLRDLQEDSLLDMGVIKTPINLKPFVENVEASLQSASLSEALGFFASLHESPKPEEIREANSEATREGSLANFFASEFVDREGKTISRSDASNFSHSENLESTRGILEHFRMLRTIVVGGQIEPARIIIRNCFSRLDAAIEQIVHYSPFVPPGYEYVFIRGIKNFMNGNMVDAGAILLPQMENSLRHVLAVSGVDTSTIESDMTQDDRSIGRLIEMERAKLIGVFGEELIFEVEYLFSTRPGPSLRNEVAHGKLGSGDYFDVDVIYACWLIFRICCLPLFVEWKEILAGVDERPVVVA